MEFVFLVGLAFTLVLVFSVVSFNQNVQLGRQKEFILVKDLAFKIQHEIHLAARVEDGYRRDFEVPQKLETIDYNVTISNTLIMVESKNEDYVLFIPHVNGTIRKGLNTIKKENGIINLN